MSASLAACGESGSSDTKETSAQSSVVATSEAQAEETTASAELQEGDSGEGEKTLDSDYCTVTIPESLQSLLFISNPISYNTSQAEKHSA